MSLLESENLFSEGGEDVKSTAAKSSSFGGYGEGEQKREASGTIYGGDKNEVIGLDDFNVKKVLGKGSFGKVLLVEKKDTGNLYAMKSIRKDILIQNDQIESTKLEKEILLKAKHPFLVKMEFVFQTDQKIYFVMNFIRGGELFTHLNKVRRFEEERAKFYAA